MKGWYSMSENELDEITHKIIGCAFKVSNSLGCGFLEKVYENALAHEMVKTGLDVRQQCPLQVFYDGIIVGDYAVDLLVEGKVFVELKAVRQMDEIMMAQCMNYLRASLLSICLLINFGRPRLEVRRIIPHQSWKSQPRVLSS